MTFMEQLNLPLPCLWKYPYIKINKKWKNSLLLDECVYYFECLFFFLWGLTTVPPNCRYGIIIKHFMYLVHNHWTINKTICVLN